MRSDLHCLHAKRLGFFCLLGALVLGACDDPDADASGKSGSPAKGSKADTPKGDSDEEPDDSEEDPPRAKADAGKVTVITSDPNQIRPKEPPVHEASPAPGTDAGAAAGPPTQASADSGAPATPRDGGPARPSSDAGR